MEEKLIFECNDEIVMQQVCELLKDNNINFIRKDEGSGSYLNITMGTSYNEKRLYVIETDFEKATKLIDEFCGQDVEIPEELKENPYVPDDDVEVHKMINNAKKWRRIVMVWLPFLMVAVLLFAMMYAK